MLNVFFTVDVEIWCHGWRDLDHRFPDAFRRYVYGPTPQGEFGLRYQCEVLRDHGLTGVFFVEPLFSGRFGLEPLAEIVGLIKERGQETQLHLHTEWVDEWPTHPVPGVTAKRQFLHNWDAREQQVLLAEGLRRLEAAGGDKARCFRAGSFGFDARTLDALVALGVPFDSSYNATAFGPTSGVGGDNVLHDLHLERGVAEWPMSVYKTGTGTLRHAQLGACSEPCGPAYGSPTASQAPPLPLPAGVRWLGLSRSTRCGARSLGASGSVGRALRSNLSCRIELDTQRQESSRITLSHSRGTVPSLPTSFAWSRRSNADPSCLVKLGTYLE